MSAGQTQQQLKWAARWRAYDTATDQLIVHMLERTEGDPIARERQLRDIQELMTERARLRVAEVVDRTREQRRRPRLVVIPGDQPSTPRPERIASSRSDEARA